MTAPLVAAPINAPAGANNAMAAVGAGDPLGIFGLLLAGLGMETSAAVQGEGKLAASPEGEASAEEAKTEDDAEAPVAEAGQALALLFAAAQTAPTPASPSLQMTAPATGEEAEVAAAPALIPPLADGLTSPLEGDAQSALNAAGPDVEPKTATAPSDGAKLFAALDAKPLATTQTAAAPTPEAAPKGEKAQSTQTTQAPAAQTAPPATTPPAAVAAAVAAQTLRPAEPGTAPRAAQTDRVSTVKSAQAIQAEPQPSEDAPTAPAPAPATLERQDAAAPFSRALTARAAAELTATADDKPAVDSKSDAAVAPQPPASMTAQAAAAPPPATGPARGSPETVAKLAADIVRKLEGATTRFEVGLDPIGLGRVEVKVEIGPSGRMHAAMTFENAQAAADVGRRSGELRAALEQAGFDLSGGSLSFDVAGQGGQGRGQAFDQNRSGGRPAQAAFEAALTLGDDALPVPSWRPAQAASGVDIRI